MKKWITVILTLALAAGLLGAVPAAAAEEQTQPELSALDQLLETLTGLRDALQAGEAELTDEMKDVLNGLAEKAGELTALLQPAEEAEEPAEEEPEEPAEEPEEPAEEEPEEPAEELDLEGLDRIGEETEEGYKIRLTNATGSNIMGMNIQKTTDDSWAWSDELLADGDRFEPDEAAVFCYTPGEGEDETTTYNVQIVFTDWTVGYLHYVLLSDMNEAQLERAANSLPYLVYTSLGSGEEIDTADAEQKAFEGELAAGVWDSVINAGKSTSSGGTSGGSYSGGGSSSGGSSTGGNTTGCVGDGALFY